MNIREHETDIIKAIESAAEKRRDMEADADGPDDWERHDNAAKALDRLAGGFAAHDYDPALMTRFVERMGRLRLQPEAFILNAFATPDDVLRAVMKETGAEAATSTPAI